MKAGAVNSNALVLIGTMIIGVLGALLLGRSIGAGSFQLPGLIMGAMVGVAIVLSLGKHYWMIIPLATPFTGSIGLIRIPFSYSELGAIATIGLFLLYLAMHKQHFGMEIRLIDWLLVINLLILLQAYLRNPAGMLFANAEIIGARAYFTVLVSVFCYIILAHSRMTHWQSRNFAYLVCIPMIVAGGIAAVTTIFPATSKFIYPFYSGVNIEELTDVGSLNSPEKRLSGLSDFANPLLLLLCAVRSPLALILPNSPFVFGTFLIIIICFGLSGFRNQFILAGSYISISSVLRRTWSELVVFLVVGLVAIAIVAGMQTSGIQLPYTFQRSLSFIPFVQWDTEAKADADASTEWRLEMWRDALASDTYIRNKVLGDGFGFRMGDFLAMQQKIMGWGGAFAQTASNEMDMVKGSFHSGPLTTIRVVGYLGLATFLPWLIFTGVEAWRLCRMTSGTPFFSGALAVGIPLIYMPFSFLFVFGDYKWNIGLLILGMGYLKMLEASFKEWRRSEDAKASVGETERPAVPTGRVPIKTASS